MTLAPGDTVVWTNRDIVPHTATAEDGSWTSPSLKEGESWAMIVETEVSADYLCAFHPAMRASLETR